MAWTVVKRGRRRPQPRTPGVFYVIRQAFPSLEWQVTSVDRAQAESMRRRGERVYDTAAQAHAIVDKLNAKRKDQPCAS